MYQNESSTLEMRISNPINISRLSPTNVLIGMGQTMTQLNLKEHLQFPLSRLILCDSQWICAIIATPKQNNYN